MNIEQDIIEYKSFMLNVNREGVDRLIDYVVNSDYFTSPASSKYHLNVEGGLYLHSKNVMKLCYKQYNMFKNLGLEYEISKESIILCALHHDLCKVNTYKKDKVWYKDEENKWQYYIGWKVDEPDLLGHGAKSLSIVQDYIQLTLEEKQAILYHMGSYDNNNQEVMKVFNINKFAEILHISDLSSLVIEKIKDYKI